MHINSDFIHITKLNKNLLSSPITTKTQTTLTDNVNNYDIIYVVTESNKNYSANNRTINTFLVPLNLNAVQRIAYGAFTDLLYDNYITIHDNILDTTEATNIGTNDGTHYRIAYVWGIKF